MQEPGGGSDGVVVLGTEHEAPPTEELLRQLLTHMGDSASPGTAGTPSALGAAGASGALSAAGTHGSPGTQVSREVLLDVELDGDRYTLVLVRTHEAHEGEAAEHIDHAEHPVTLSPREQEIARLIMKGLPNKTIAAVLDISLWTVATYVRRLFAKLSVSSRAEMVARVLEAGLVNSRDG